MLNNQHQGFGEERTPAQQAKEMTEKAKASMNITAQKAKHIWFGFSRPEKIVAAGALFGVVAFFLPWVSAGGKSITGLKAGSESIYVYLLPFFMVMSLVLLYFTQGASESGKTLAARWQIVIGSAGTTIGLIMIILIRGITDLLEELMGGFGTLFGASSFSANAGIGAYLFAIGSIVIVVGAFKLQALLIKERRKN